MQALRNVWVCDLGIFSSTYRCRHLSRAALYFCCSGVRAGVCAVGGLAEVFAHAGSAKDKTMDSIREITKPALKADGMCIVMLGMRTAPGLIGKRGVLSRLLASTTDLRQWT